MLTSETLATLPCEQESGAPSELPPIELDSLVDLMPVRRPNKRQRLPRKPTYYKRKEETEALQTQLEFLKAQLACLKTENQILATTSEQQHQQQLSTLRARRSLLRSRIENDVLREAAQTQQFAIARAHSAFSTHVSAHCAELPFASTIRLGRDWNERCATLMSIKEQKIRAAQRYVAERSQYLDPFARYNDTTRFVNSSGDYCTLIFDILPFEGEGVSFKQVYDALLFYFFNMEISITEQQGDLVVRENDENWILPLDFSQNRLLAGERSDGVQIETNTIDFCQLHEAGSVEAVKWGGGREFGVVVGNSVYEDELYPYSPKTRIRHDVVGTIVVTLEPRKKLVGSRDRGGSHESNSREEVDEDLVVVLKRVGFLTVRATKLPVSPSGMEELRRSVEGWADAMLKTVEEIVYQQRPSQHDVQATPTSVGGCLDVESV